MKKLRNIFMDNVKAEVDPAHWGTENGDQGAGNHGQKPNLIFVICLDAPGSESNRYLAKMLVSSLLRTYFTGDIVVFRNSPNPLFLVERKGLEEVYLDTEQLSGKEGADARNRGHSIYQEV